jgi:hypothetical protein
VKIGSLAALTLLLFLYPPLPKAEACECVAVTPFNEIVKTAEVVFTGKVIATHLNTTWDEAAPDYVDVEVEAAARGEVVGVVRVWDLLGKTSCNGALRRLGVGMRVEFAVGAAASWEPWEAKPGEPTPHPTAMSACGKPWRYAMPIQRRQASDAAPSGCGIDPAQHERRPV